MIIYKSAREIEIMRICNQRVAHVLEELKEVIKPSITTKDIENRTDELAEKYQLRAAFKGYKNFPSSICVSVNNEVVHGIPTKDKWLKEGDIVSLDFGGYFEGYYGDSAITVPVGEISEETNKLLEVTKESLNKAIEKCRVLNDLNDLSRSIQNYVEENGFSVVRDFVGHGIGVELHEDPQVPNYVVNKHNVSLKPGMVLAIEPMVNAGSYKVKVLNDGWTAVTVDGKNSAHFEHTVAITENEPLILSKL